MKGLPDVSREMLDWARLNRDARFDGRFFIGITTDGTYCRPICPLAAANNSEVRYFALAAEAAEEGYRPCQRCRPEMAPGLAAWVGTSAVVRRALRLIQGGILQRESIEDFARRFGISGRHMGRLFAQHIGASPTMIAQTRRIHFARRLLDETRMPIAAIASASGFTSVRRFNDAFLKSYRVSPRKLRCQPGSLADEGAAEVRFKLAYRPPYDWDQLYGFLSKRAIGGVEAIEGSEYVRALRTPSGHALVRVRRAESTDALDVMIRGAAPSDMMPLVTSVQRMFDLTADPTRIAGALRADPLLRPLIERRPGLRIPGAADAFECCVRAVLGMGLSVTAGRALLHRLVSRLGQRIDASPHGITHLFPSPDAIADAKLAEFDLSDRHLRALRLVARAARDQTINFDESSGELERALAHVPGVGRWVAGYVALRGLGEADAFPYGDLILRREASSREFPLSAQELSARATRWRPFRGYAAFHLWCDAATRELVDHEIHRETSR